MCYLHYYRLSYSITQ